jgi:hypothetical protein
VEGKAIMRNENFIVEKYRPLIYRLSMKYYIKTVGNQDDIMQFLYEILLNIDIEHIMDVRYVKRVLHRKLIDELRVSQSFNKDETILIDDVDHLDYHMHNQYDLIPAVENYMMRSIFKEKIIGLIKYLEMDEIKLLNFYMNQIDSGNIPGDRYTCRELYGLSGNSGSFRNKKRSLYGKIYIYFKDFIDNRYFGDSVKPIGRIKKKEGRDDN